MKGRLSLSPMLSAWFRNPCRFKAPQTGGELGHHCVCHRLAGSVGAGVEAALTVMGLCGLVGLLWRGYAFAWVVSATLVAYPAVYYVIQVSPRYRFPLEPILFLLAADLLVHCAPHAIGKQLAAE